MGEGNGEKQERDRGEKRGKALDAGHHYGFSCSCLCSSIVIFNTLGPRDVPIYITNYTVMLFIVMLRRLNSI